MKKVFEHVTGGVEKVKSANPQDAKKTFSQNEIFEDIEKKWRALYAEGNISGSYELLKAREDIFAKESVTWAKMLALMAYNEVDLGLYELAKVHSTRADQILRDTAENKHFALLKVAQGLLLLRLCDISSGVKFLEDALSTYRRIGDKRNQAKVCNLIAQAHYMRSNWREALEKTQMAIDLATEAKAHMDIPFYLLNRGLIQIFLGEWGQAKKNLEKALDLSEIEREQDLSAAYQALGLLYLYQRKWDLAKLYLEKSLDSAKDKGSKRNIAIAYEYLGELAYKTGKLDEAISFLRKVPEVLDPKNLGDFQNQIERREAQVYLAQGKIQETISLAKKAIKASRHMEDRFEEAVSLRVLGVALAKKGERREAVKEIKKAIEIFEDISEKYERAKSAVEIGNILSEGDSTERKEALAYLIKGNEIAKSLYSPYLQGIANFSLARLKLINQDSDGALLYLDEAENILRASKEREVLNKVLKFRRKIESHMVEAALKASEGYSLLERWRTNSFTIDELLNSLVTELNADRAFLATTSENGKYHPLAFINLKKHEINDILKILTKNGIKDRVPIAASRANFHFLEDEFLIAIPFDVGIGLKGLLFLSRSSSMPFTQEHITFLSLSADLFAFKLQLKGSAELLKENLRLKKQLLEEARFFGIVTRNSEMLNILTMIDRIATSTIPILIQGETGTGKELIARAIHYSSERKDQPFIPLNCANISETLLESELFGHKRGAFTDAKEDKKGWFEVADGGTIFLDEIAEMGAAAQSKILRFLEHHEILPLGGREPIRVDVRVIAATNKDLEKEVEKGTFREDLYYRLKVFPISLPPLRDRKEDIPILVNYFIKKFAKEVQKDPPPIIHPKAMDILLSYDWPGNVRELENEMRRAVAILPKDQREITQDFLSIKNKVCNNDMIPLEVRLQRFEKNAIEEALKRTNDVKIKAAKILGIPESTLRRKIKKYNIQN